MQYLKYKNLINVRRLAVHNRLSDDLDVYIDKCYRHYSKTYHTPLHVAQSILTAEEVALIFMEDEMEEWSVENVMEVKEALRTDDQPVIDCAQEKSNDVVDDDTWIAQQNAALKKQDEESKKKSAQAAVMKQTHDAIEKLTESFKSITKEIESKKE